MRRSVLIPLLSLVLLTASAAGRPPAVRSADPQLVPKSEIDARQERDRQKSLNKSRHEQIKKDTDKLLTLAAELKQYVDKTNENVMSLDVIKKAEEVERLAHSVRAKMKEDYTPPPGMIP